MIIEESFTPKVTLQTLDEIESKYKIQFPQAYKIFLINSNGGYPVPNIFEFSLNATDKEQAMVDCFFGIHDGEHGTKMYRMGGLLQCQRWL